MTRLADALERANSRAGGPAPARPAGPAAHAPLAAAPAPAPALALVNATPENDPRLTEGPSLLALPRRPNGPAGWRTDPELIGKWMELLGDVAPGLAQEGKPAKAVPQSSPAIAASVTVASIRGFFLLFDETRRSH